MNDAAPPNSPQVHRLKIMKQNLPNPDHYPKFSSLSASDHSDASRSNHAKQTENMPITMPDTKQVNNGTNGKHDVIPVKSEPGLADVKDEKSSVTNGGASPVRDRNAPDHGDPSIPQNLLNTISHTGTIHAHPVKPTVPRSSPSHSPAHLPPTHLKTSTSSTIPTYSSSSRHPTSTASQTLITTPPPKTTDTNTTTRDNPTPISTSTLPTTVHGGHSFTVDNPHDNEYDNRFEDEFVSEDESNRDDDGGEGGDDAPY